MRRALAALDRHWFAPASLRELAIVRALAFGSQTLVFVWLPVGRARPLAEHLHQARAAGSEYAPMLLLRGLLFPFGQLSDAPPSAAFLTATFVVAVVAGALAAVGLWARPAMLAAAGANALLVAHHYSYGEFHHAEALMVIALGVLALGPSAARLSVDAWRKRTRGDTDGIASDLDVFARWPLRLIQWLIALSYLSAAGTKLATGGLAWFNGYTMSYQFMVLASGGERDVAAFMATVPPRWHIPASAFAWLFEALFFVAVLVPRTAWLFILAGLLMHLGVYATMGIAFFQTMLLYSAFVDSLRRYPPPWSRVARATRQRVPGGESPLRV